MFVLINLLVSCARKTSKGGSDTSEADTMAWFGPRATKPKRVNRFEQADPVVVNLFADLRRARYLKCNQAPGISWRSVEQFERQAWMRLIDYLVKLPPL